MGGLRWPGGVTRCPGQHERCPVLWVLIVLPLSLGLAARAAEARAQSPDRSARSDSLKLAAALSYRGLGTIEGRARAIDLLQELSRHHPENPTYDLELAETYLEGHRSANALDVYERLARRDPDQIEAHIRAARLILKDMLRHLDLHNISKAIRHLDCALSRLPEPTGMTSVSGDSAGYGTDRRDALYLRSMALYLRRGTDKDPLQTSEEGRRSSAKILEMDPHDVSACLLHAVHCVDLEEYDEADRFFRWAFERMGPMAAPFLAPIALSDRDEYKAHPERRADLIEQYWKGLDPTPATVTNELQIKYWYRTAVADIYFGDEEKGLRGWETAPGRFVQAFGLPARFDYDPGSLSKSLFVTASLRFDYANGLAFTFSRGHPAHPWLATPGDLAVLQGRTKRGSAIAEPRIPGEISPVYISQASFRGRDGTTRQACIVGIPPWSRGRDWWESATVRIDLLDDESKRIRSEERVVSGTDVRDFPSGRRMLIVGRDFEGLAPGNYKIHVQVRQEGSHRSGSRHVAAHVEAFGQGLQVSGMEPVSPGTARWRDVVLKGPGISRPYLPDPAATLGPKDELEFAFEIYNLTFPNGVGRYRMTHTIFPAEYEREWQRLWSTGRVTQADSALFGREGHTLGGVTLSKANRREIQFPGVEVTEARLLGAPIRAMARINATGLPTGCYIFRIEVEDLVSGQKAAREISFDVVPDALLNRANPSP